MANEGFLGIRDYSKYLYNIKDNLESMKDEIMSYREMCNKIYVNTIQKGMNFRLKNAYSIILMSVRKNAPYNDEIDYNRNLLIYEGHDVAKTNQNIEPKRLDQPIWTDKGTLTENGKFVKAVERYKRGLIEAEKIIVFEKLSPGVWSEKGVFYLVDYANKISNGRKVFKFYLQPSDEDIKIDKEEDRHEHTRLIPTSVKVEVWKRDKGKCQICGSKRNLHYDHDLPFSKGGSSITAKNVRILCARCNLKKKDNIE